MYNKIVKNSQIHIGVPFQLRIPPEFQHLAASMEEAAACAESIPAQEQEDEEQLLSQAREEAELIIREAEMEADRIVGEALKTAELETARIHEETVTKAREEARKEMEQQYRSLLEEAEEVKHKAESQHQDMLEKMESEIVDLALEIARKVIGEEISQNRNIILRMAKQAFDRCSNKENAVLRVSPEDFETLEQNKEQLLAMNIGTLDLEMRKDCSMKPGGCVVDTAFGSVDAGAETKLKQIEQEFKQVVGK